MIFLKWGKSCLSSAIDDRKISNQIRQTYVWENCVNEMLHDNQHQLIVKKTEADQCSAFTEVGRLRYSVQINQKDFNVLYTCLSLKSE